MEIARRSWARGEAQVGEEVRLLIEAPGIADGTEVRATVRASGDGRVWGEASGRFAQGTADIAWQVVVPPETHGSEAPVLLGADLSIRGVQEAVPVPLAVRGFFDLRWHPEKGRDGDVIEIRAKSIGLPDGTEVRVSVWEEDVLTEHDFMASFGATVDRGAIRSQWTYVYSEDADDVIGEEESRRGYTLPEYYFRIEHQNLTARSGLLHHRNWVEIDVEDDDGRPVTDAMIEVTFPNGEVYRVSPDRDGRVFLEDVPPGEFDLRIL